MCGAAVHGLIQAIPRAHVSQPVLNVASQPPLKHPVSGIPHIGSLQAQWAAQTRWSHHSQVLQGQSNSGLSNKGCDSCREPCYLSVFVVFGSLARADRRGTRTSRSPRIRLVVDGAGVEPVAGYGASPAPFPQFLPRWARAEALDRPTGTTVVALDARRRVPRRPDVVQLDAGEIAGNDRVPLGGRVRSRPRPCSWSTCAGRDSQESGSRPSKSLISRRSP